ncbi:MAG: hypothetical protein RBR09_12375, partial [Desulfobulbaceae bacterium]|nr:hypothetical protein [Desulfobulbaceae bacterium]
LDCLMRVIAENLRHVLNFDFVHGGSEIFWSTRSNPRCRGLFLNREKTGIWTVFSKNAESLLKKSRCLKAAWQLFTNDLLSVSVHFRHSQ